MLASFRNNSLQSVTMIHQEIIMSFGAISFLIITLMILGTIPAWPFIMGII